MGRVTRVLAVGLVLAVFGGIIGQASAHKMKPGPVRHLATKKQSNHLIRAELRQAHEYRVFNGRVTGWKAYGGRCYRERKKDWNTGRVHVHAVSCRAVITIRKRRSDDFGDGKTNEIEFANVSPRVSCGTKGFVNRWKRNGCWVDPLDQFSFEFNYTDACQVPVSVESRGKQQMRKFLRGGKFVCPEYEIPEEEPEPVPEEPDPPYEPPPDWLCPPHDPCGDWDGT